MFSVELDMWFYRFFLIWMSFYCYLGDRISLGRWSIISAVFISFTLDVLAIYFFY